MLTADVTGEENEIGYNTVCIITNIPIRLEKVELESLVLASFSITIELASRFLDDYLTGDLYFRCNYPKHNLVRTRCQLQLAKDIERKWDELTWIIRDVTEKLANKK